MPWTSTITNIFVSFKHNNDVSAQAEKKVCIIKIFTFFLSLLYGAIYSVFINKQLIWQGQFWYIFAGSIWFLASVSHLILIQKTKYKTWFSYVATFSDIALAAAIQIIYSFSYELNYLSNFIVSLYFLAISLSAMRINERLVILSGISCGLIYILVSYALTVIYQLKFNEEIFWNHEPVGSKNILDYSIKGAAMGIVGWIVGYVKRDIGTAEKKYEFLFEHAPLGILTISPDEIVKSANASFLKMTDVTLYDVLGRKLSDFTFENKNHEKFLNLGNIKLPVEIIKSKISIQDETIRIVSIRDISHQKILTDQVRQIKKAETLGQIARGLAHDFNNVLGGIIGANSLISFHIKDINCETGLKLINQGNQKISEYSQNARNILARLLSLSRNSSEKNSRIDLVKILTELIMILKKTNLLEHKITLLLRNNDEKAWVKGDEAALFQALLNISVNAMESMAQKGEIEIILQPLVQIKDFWGVPGYLKYWEIIVSDQGCGMDEQILSKSMEPFFSKNKASSHCSGLGLPIAFSIVRSHDGFIEIKSKPAIGTKVKICLPQKKL